MGNVIYSLVFWLLSIPAIGFSVAPIAGALPDVNGISTIPGNQFWVTLLGMVSLAAWLSLAVMNVTWVRRTAPMRRLAFFGSVAGWLALLSFTVLTAGMGLLFALPGLLLAAPVTGYHFRRANENAA